MSQLEFVFMNHLDDLQDLRFHHFLDVYWLSSRTHIQTTYVWLKTTNYPLQLLLLLIRNTTIDAPVLPFLLKLLQLIFEESPICLTEIIIIIRKALPSPFHGVECFSIISQFQIANTHIGQSQCISWVMLYCLFVILDSFFIFELTFEDIS